MKELNILTSLTNINDTWIDETAEMPVAVAVAPRRSFWRRLSDAANSPVGVALICGVVALGVLAGIIAAGQNAPNTPTVNPPAGGSVSNPSNQTEPSNSLDLVPPDTAEVEATLRPPLTDSSPNFDFSFTIDEGGVFKRGTTYNITTTLTNVGKAFTYSGSSTDFFAEATLLYHSGQTSAYEHPIGYEIQGMFPITDDYVENYEVVQGKTANRTGHFIIPDTAPTGQYDLKLSYKGEYVIYENAVSIYGEERFAFAYEDIGPIPEEDNVGPFVGGWIIFSASVTNLGAPFTAEGFFPTVTFVCRDTGYKFNVKASPSGDIVELEVATDQTGEMIYCGYVPDDADVGIYDLVLSYGEESRTFYEVIRISVFVPPEPVTEAPPKAMVESSFTALEVAKAYIEENNIALPFAWEDFYTHANYDPRDRSFFVSISYFLGGVSTDFHMQMIVWSDGTVTDFRSSSWSKSSYFFRYTHDDVKEAISRIENAEEGYLELIEKHGKLYVVHSVDVELPDKPGVYTTMVVAEEEVRHEEATTTPGSVINDHQEAMDAACDYLAIYHEEAPYPMWLSDMRMDYVYTEGDTAGQGTWQISARCLLAGIHTDFYYHFTVITDGSVTITQAPAWEESPCYMNVTEADVYAAMQRIGDTDPDGYYFEEKDGKLYICKEILNIPEESNNNVFYREEVRHES